MFRIRLLIVSAVFCLLAHPAVGPAEESSPTTNPKAAKNPRRDEEAAGRSLEIVVAEHVILWDGRIVTWDELIDGLREMRERVGKPIQPQFRFTNGAVAAGYFEKRQRDLFKVYEELFQPAGMSLGTVSPRASPRYDAIKVPADLIPPPEQVRKGIVRAPGGRVVSIGIVVLIPEDAVMPVMLRQDLTLRDPLDEVWTRLDKGGRFEIPSPDAGYRLAILSPVGFAVADVPPHTEPVKITLAPSATLEIASQDQSAQELGLSIHAPHLPPSFPGFSIYEVKIGDKPAELRIPPGRVTVSRSFSLGMGASRLVPATTLNLEAGARQKLVLEPGDPSAITE